MFEEQINYYALLLKSLFSINKLPSDFKNKEKAFYYIDSINKEIESILSNKNNSKLISLRFQSIRNLFQNLLRLYSQSYQKFMSTLENRVQICLEDEMQNKNYKNVELIPQYEEIKSKEDLSYRLCFIDLALFDIELDLDTSELIKEISFPPEYKQAGISILNYFSDVIDSKYPDKNVSVTIRQEGTDVFMVVVFPSGEEKIITKTLEDYGKVITGRMLPEELMENKISALALEHKLELARLEVSHTRDLLMIEKSSSTSKIRTLEQEVKRLFSVINTTLSSSAEEKSKLISLLRLEKNKNSNTLLPLIETLNKHYEEENTAKAKQVLTNLKKDSPTIFDNFNEIILKGAVAGASGNLFYTWILAIIQVMPK